MGSDRLEGLSGRGGRGGSKAGRFAPNMVSRRSKEQRDNTAPAIKSEHQSDNIDSAARSAPKRRQQRHQGTRQEAAGPLAAPSAPDRMPSRGSSLGISRGSTSDGAGRLSGSVTTPSAPRTTARLASLQNSQIKADPESLAAEFSRIDMADNKRSEAYFPLRVPTATAEVDADSSSVELPKLHQGPLYLVQLPDLGLDTRKFSSPNLKTEEENDGPAPENMSIDAPPFPHAKLGTLRYHQSGRMSMLIGDMVMEVTPGTQTSSVEDAVLIQKNRATHVGAIESLLLTVPDF